MKRDASCWSCKHGQVYETDKGSLACSCDLKDFCTDYYAIECNDYEKEDFVLSDDILSKLP